MYLLTGNSDLARWKYQYKLNHPTEQIREDILTQKYFDEREFPENNAFDRDVLKLEAQLNLQGHQGYDLKLSLRDMLKRDPQQRQFNFVPDVSPFL
jgi:hypothetical protein